VPITEQEIQDILQREIGKAEIEYVTDREDYRLHALKSGDHVLIRKDNGWGWVARPNKQGVHRKVCEFGPSNGASHVHVTRKIGVGIHTAADVLISFHNKTITLMLLRFEGGVLENSATCYVDVPWFGKDESLEEMGRKVLVTAEQLGLVEEGKTEARIIDIGVAVHHNHT